MKTRLLIAVLFCCTSVGAQGGPPESKASRNQCSAADREQIGAIAQQWKTLYNAGNSAGVASLYLSDAYYLTQHFASGIVHGRAAIQSYVQRGVDAHYRIDSIIVLQTTCSGDFAYAIGRYNSTNAGQKAMGVNLIVLRKVGRQWMIAAHEAAVPEPSAIKSLNAD